MGGVVLMRAGCVLRTMATCAVSCLPRGEECMGHHSVVIGLVEDKIMLLSPKGGGDLE